MKHNADRPSKSPEPIPELGYETPWIKSPFQEACIEIAKAFLNLDLDPIEWIYKSELHVVIPLLVASEVNSQKAIGNLDFATHFGIKIGPQGFAETGWMGEDDYLVEHDQIYLRHPAEILEIALAHTKGPFSANRAKLDSSVVFRPMMQGDEPIYLSGTPLYDLNLNPQYDKIHEKISELVDDVFILLEEEPYKGRLLSVTKLKDLNGGLELLNILDKNANSNRAAYSIFPFCDTIAPYGEDFASEWKGNLSAFNKAAKKIAKDSPDELPHASYHDIILGFQYDLSSVQLLGLLHHHSVNAPKLVLRPNRSKISLLRLFDLFTTTHNPRDIFYPLAGWRKKSKDLKAEIEKSPLDQIRASLSFRQTIQRYSIDTNLSTYDALVGFGGDEYNISFATIPNTLDERERHIQSLQESYPKFIEFGYKQLLGPPEPLLPHFLEIAYQRFMDSSSERSISANSRSLLNLLGRTPLFLMLEDVNASGQENEVTDAIRSEILSGKPISDGRFLDLQLNLIQSIKSVRLKMDISPFVTENLMNCIPSIITNHLKPIVEKRNRANHEPYDEESFLEESRNQFPSAIKQFRQAFRNLEILVPRYIKYEKGSLGEYILTAQTLTGHRFEYPDREFLSEIDPKSISTDTLMICSVGPHQSQPSKTTMKPDMSPEENNHRKDVRENNKYSCDFSSLKVILDEIYKNRKKLSKTTIFQAVPLTTLFNMKTSYKKMIMTGVFSGISKDGPVFEYVEEAI